MRLNTKVATFAGGALAVLAILAISKPAITAVYSTPVRDVEDPARYPVQAKANGLVVDAGDGEAVTGTDPVTNPPVYTVPQGYRLVIDDVSVGITFNEHDQWGRATWEVHNPDPTAHPDREVSPRLDWAYTNLDKHAAWGSTPTRIFVEPGGVVNFRIERFAPNNNKINTAFSTIATGFSGHLVPLP